MKSKTDKKINAKSTFDKSTFIETYLFSND